jgi:CMP-N-acetylneuraminic acid synthetase
MDEKPSFFLGVIPARGGSKGIKDKNIRSVAGRPLIAYTIEAARASVELDACIVSTDSERIAAVAIECGGSVPFMRPAELARDESPTVDTLIHAVTWYEGEHSIRIHAVVVLQPTAPLRTAEDIDASIRLFKEGRARSLFSCYE